MQTTFWSVSPCESFTFLFLCKWQYLDILVRNSRSNFLQSFTFNSVLKGRSCVRRHPDRIKSLHVYLDENIFLLHSFPKNSSIIFPLIVEKIIYAGAVFFRILQTRTTIWLSVKKINSWNCFMCALNYQSFTDEDIASYSFYLLLLKFSFTWSWRHYALSFRLHTCKEDINTIEMI